VAYSFNETRSVSQWSGFTLDWYAKVFENKEMKEAAWNSLQIAGFATVVATTIATMAALATTRTRPWRGQTAAYMTINMPLMVPEIVTAIATLIFFALLFNVLGLNFGIGNLMIAHTVFCIPFAYMPIRARLEDMDKHAGAGRRRPLRHALADLPPRHAAADDARHHGGRHAGLRRLLRRLHHHGLAGRPRPVHAADLHLDLVAPRHQPRDQCHVLAAAAGLGALGDGLVHHRQAPEVISRPCEQHDMIDPASASPL
jgi:hypothetical protein